ncbi:MAG: GTPase ObgE [Fidelibacterota bacterium]
MFIDYTKVELQAGNGGPGSVSFRREKFVPKGGPDGGDGGRGGNIIIKVDANLRTLRDIRYARAYRAENGQPGSSNQKSGRDGKDVLIPVPQGTIVRDLKTNTILADVTIPGKEVIICKGGKGGRGNTQFKTATKQSPRYAQPGTPGEKGLFEFELKVIADVGLVGLPNAGKSTLLSVLSAARPKIADYPFTTLEPHLGIVKYGEYKSFVMADIPGLIEGAAKGKGLGHRFLRHIERNKLLLFLIESSESNPKTVFQSLKEELYQFNRDLLLKPILLVRSKSDLLAENNQDQQKWERIPEYVIDISAVSGAGLLELIQIITGRLNES